MSAEVGSYQNIGAAHQDYHPNWPPSPHSLLSWWTSQYSHIIGSNCLHLVYFYYTFSLQGSGSLGWMEEISIDNLVLDMKTPSARSLSDYLHANHKSPEQKLLPSQPSPDRDRPTTRSLFVILPKLQT